jgi:MerR family copper efflux transcriptional regulator
MYFCNMLINELAKRTGITAHTIRFYEKSGLIQGKRDEKVRSNNYFHYDEETVEKLELIKDAKSIGFTISEISNLMDAWYSNKMNKAEKLNVLKDKMQAINEKINQLIEMKQLIGEFMNTVENENC